MLPVRPRRIADAHWQRRKRFRANFVLRKIRIAQLEAEVQHYREKSERAEEWLRKISAGIEDRLTNQSMERRREVFGRP